MSLITDIKQRLAGDVLTPAEALELIAAVQQRVITPEPRHRFNGGGAIQGTVPAPDNLNAVGQYVHPAARVVRGSRLIQQ